MTLKFYNKLINSVEKIDAVTHEEKLDKIDVMATILKVIDERGGKCLYVKGKWTVIQK